MPTSLDPAFSVKSSVTLTNANQAYEFLPDARTARVTVQFDTNAGFVGHTGTEGVALTHKFPVAADSPFEFILRSGVFYLESATGGTTVSILCEAS